MACCVESNRNAAWVNRLYYLLNTLDSILVVKSWQLGVPDMVEDNPIHFVAVIDDLTVFDVTN